MRPVTNRTRDWDSVRARAGVDDDGGYNCATSAVGGGKLLWVREDLSQQSLNGADLLQESLYLAGCLKSLGVAREDRVAVCLSRRPEAFTLALASWSLGAIYVPLFSGFGSESMVVRINDCSPKLLFVDRTTLAQAAGVSELADAPVVVDVDGGGTAEVQLPDLKQRSDPLGEMVRTHLDEPATIMYTSGTTGTPKGCVIGHKGLLSLWPYVERCLALDDGVLFSAADPGWSFGLYTTGLGPLSLGKSRLLYEGGFDADRWWDIVDRFDVTHLASAPTAFRQLMAHGAPSSRPSCLEAATTAGEPLDQTTFEWFRSKLDLEIHDSYGLTELGMVVANLRPGPASALEGRMGVALPGFEVATFDDSGDRADVGEPGRLGVKDNGFLLGTGYWTRDEDWRRRWIDDWWVTEDLVRREADGSFTYLGRSDDVIVTSGYNVGPSEVEAAVLSHPLVKDVACIGEVDSRKGQIVVAYVVVSPGTDESVLGDEIRMLVGERIGRHAAPRRLEVVDSLPRTESGKVIRAQLRERSREGAERAIR